MSGGGARAGRSIIGKIFDNFMGTTFGEGKRVVIGKDHFGNVYYVFDGDTRRATKRGYIPSDTQKWERMPVEWEAWLRGRRRDPPGMDEIERNASITESARLGGEKIEQQRAIERQREAERDDREFLEAAANDPKKGGQQKQSSSHDPNQPHDSSLRRMPLPDIKTSRVEGTPGEKTKEFPSHKDYEMYPGEEPKQKK